MKSKMTLPKNPRNNTSSATTGAIGGAVAGGALSSATSMATPVITSCPPEDTSFMCKLTRFYNSFKMIIGIAVIVLLIVAVIWFAVIFFRARK